MSYVYKSCHPGGKRERRDLGGRVGDRRTGGEKNREKERERERERERE